MQWNPVSGAAFYDRYRFSPALLGTGDASQVLAYFWQQVPCDQAVFDEVRATAPNSYLSLLNLIFGTIVPGDLSNASQELKLYTYGPRAGQAWGYRFSCDYAAQASDIALERPSFSYQVQVGMIGADDGTIAWSADGGRVGSSVEQVPVLTVRPGNQEAAWNDLSAQLTVLSDLAERNPYGLDVPITQEAVTDPGNLAAPPGTSPPQILAQGANLPALIAVPTSIALLANLPAVAVVATAALGMVASTIWNSGLVGKAADWLTRSEAAGDVATAVSTGLSPVTTGVQSVANTVGDIAQAISDLLAALDRIADALEAIQEELCEVPGDPTKPGLTRAVELASQARSEITLRAHGQIVTCSTGSIEEVEP